MAGLEDTPIADISAGGWHSLALTTAGGALFSSLTAQYFCSFRSLTFPVQLLLNPTSMHLVLHVQNETDAALSCALRHRGVRVGAGGVRAPGARRQERLQQAAADARAVHLWRAVGLQAAGCGLRGSP